jgi:hypothetical protein
VLSLWSFETPHISCTHHWNPPPCQIVVYVPIMNCLHPAEMARNYWSPDCLIRRCTTASTLSTSVSWGEPFTFDNSATASHVTLFPSSAASTTTVRPIQSRVSSASSFDVASSGESGDRSVTGSASATASSVGVVEYGWCGWDEESGCCVCFGGGSGGAVCLRDEIDGRWVCNLSYTS